MTTDDREALRRQLLIHEGIRLRPYRCTAGKLTIGVGRNLESKGISAATAMQMLEEDIEECLADLSSFGWFAGLDPVRQRAVIDMRFQLGPHRFRGFTKMLSALERGDYVSAALEAGFSAWAEQTPKRAARIVKQIRSGEP